MTIPPQEKDIGYERLIMLTDGVFGIAITLLALEIRIPDLSNNALLGQAILNLLPQIFVFALSFVQVGLFWVAHTGMFRHIERSDGRFLVLCLAYLMVIAFLPVPSGTLGRYGSEFPAVEFFAFTMLLVGLLELAIWKYATYNRRLTRPSLTDEQIRGTTLRTLYVIIIFGLSMVIALFSPIWAMWSWLLLILVRPLMSRVFKRSHST